MLVLGVDPGISGGLALLSDTGELKWAEVMPVLRNTVPTVDSLAFRNLLFGLTLGSVFAYVERAQAMPRQGVSSAFNYGVIFGSILTAIADLGIGYEFVSPAKWKRDLGLKSDKRDSIDRVRQLYPTFHVKRSEDGIAEAILIARFGLSLQATRRELTAA